MFVIWINTSPSQPMELQRSGPSAKTQSPHKPLSSCRRVFCCNALVGVVWISHTEEAFVSLGFMICLCGIAFIGWLLDCSLGFCTVGPSISCFLPVSQCLMASSCPKRCYGFVCTWTLGWLRANGMPCLCRTSSQSSFACWPYWGMKPDVCRLHSWRLYGFIGPLYSCKILVRFCTSARQGETRSRKKSYETLIVKSTLWPASFAGISVGEEWWRRFSLLSHLGGKLQLWELLSVLQCWWEQRFMLWHPKNSKKHPKKKNTLKTTKKPKRLKQKKAIESNHRGSSAVYPPLCSSPWPTQP